MKSKHEEGNANVAKLAAYVEQVKNKECNLPMRNGSVFVKGVCEAIMGISISRAPTWINTREDAANLMDELRELSGNVKNLEEIQVTTSEMDELRMKVSVLEKKLALKEMQVIRLEKDLSKAKSSQEHTQETGRLTGRLEFCLSK